MILQFMLEATLLIVTISVWKKKHCHVQLLSKQVNVMCVNFEKQFAEHC